MKAMMGLVIAILVVSILTLFWPESTGEKASSTPEVSTAQQASEITVPDSDSSSEAMQQDQHVQQMKAEYELLEQARKELKRHLARLKHEMWGKKFPPEQAKEINQIMLNAHKFEKTPRMLGAFHDADEIQDERDRVLFAIKSLEEVEAWIQQENAEIPAGEQEF
ncbi:MAG: hypothetical protein RLT87_04800 [Gammaproteobacteria bacterium]